jgi:aspartyl-tRNA(Asn)/glutamyl-tRNA(Gln) amidotransferase subunit B
MAMEPVIGLEIHVQLNTRSKMFCSSPNPAGSLSISAGASASDETQPNIFICEICTGQPGVLPRVNREAIEKGIMIGLALNCEIPGKSKFDRKHYFYPDLPKGYQISQYDQPIAIRGSLLIGGTEKIRITRVHLEEDAGKLIHPPGGNFSLVDFNRAGVPLVEIVTEPDLRSAADAKRLLQELRIMMRYLGVSDADMEKGQMRCDANISLRKIGDSTLPSYKVEIKNLNSFKAVEQALLYEISRQEEILQKGEKLLTETRGWDDTKGMTIGQRTKEEAQDYRYFPEPDLPILDFTPAFIQEIRARLPELPQAKRARFIDEYQLPAKDAATLVESKELAGYFEDVVSELREWLSVEGKQDAFMKLVKHAANWCLSVFTAHLTEAGISPSESKVSSENFAELLKLIEQGKVSSTAGKDIFVEMFATGGDPSDILDRKELAQVSDAGELQAAIERVLAAHPKPLEDFQKGKQQALQFLAGQVMKETKGRANPQIVQDLLRKSLSR